MNFLSLFNIYRSSRGERFMLNFNYYYFNMFSLCDFDKVIYYNCVF